jgi:hypothetical protein
MLLNINKFNSENREIRNGKPNRIYLVFLNNNFHVGYGGRRGRDVLVVGFTTTYAISAYHH